MEDVHPTHVLFLPHYVLDTDDEVILIGSSENYHHMMVRMPSEHYLDIMLDSIGLSSDVNLTNISKVSRILQEIIKSDGKNAIIQNIKLLNNMKYLKEFHTNSHIFARLYFKYKSSIREVYEVFHKRNPDTIVCNSDTMYSMKMFREWEIPSTGWWAIKYTKMPKYDEKREMLIVKTNPSEIYADKSMLGIYVKHHDIDIPPYKDNSITGVNSPIPPGTLLPKQRYLLAFFDIETRQSKKSKLLGENFTKPFDRENVIFCICMSVYWSDDQEKAIRKVAFITPETNTKLEILKDIEVIKCKSEKRLILKFSEILGEVYPAFISGYNDSCFDWNFIFTKAVQYGILSKFYRNITRNLTDLNINKYGLADEHLEAIDIEKLRKLDKSIDEVRKTKIKIRSPPVLSIVNIKLDATSNPVNIYIEFIGISCVDTLTCVKKITENKELSYKLNDILIKYKQLPKDDMPYKRMFEIYDKAIAGEQEGIDEMAKVVHYCMQDADSCNNLWKKCKILQSAISIATVTMIPIIRDFRYANSIKVMNLIIANGKNMRIFVSAEFDDEEYDEDRPKYGGAYVHEPLLGRSFCPAGALDFKSLYPSIIIGRNISPDMVITNKKEIAGREHEFLESTIMYAGDEYKGWFEKHNDEEEKMGLYGRILLPMFRYRRMLKDELEVIEHKIANIKKGNMKGDLVELNLDFDIKNSFQIAFKVMMNCFYGTTGMFRSPLFMLIVAATITQLGVNLIKEVQSYAELNYFRILYGDTDSMYVTRFEKELREKCFHEEVKT
jgi:DNA polymerase elongation subunit (family B)